MGGTECGRDQHGDRLPTSGGHGVTRSRVLGAAAIALVLLAAGCSSDDGSGAAPPTTDATTTTVAPTTTVATSPPASSLDLAVTAENAGGLPGFDIFRPRDLDATGAPLPVVVWANGGCFRYNDAYEGPTFEQLAAAGYFVIAVGLLTYEESDGRSSSTTTADQAEAIDWALAENDRPQSPYHQHLDPDRIALAGNSCGGVTSLQLAATDDRVSAVYVLSGSSIGPGAPIEEQRAVMSEIHVPVLYAVGEPGIDVAAAEAAEEYDLLPEGVPALVANHAGTDHPRMSGDTAIQTEAAAFAVDWFDVAFTGNETARASLLAEPPAGWTVTAKNLG